MTADDSNRLLIGGAIVVHELCQPLLAASSWLRVAESAVRNVPDPPENLLVALSGAKEAQGRAGEILRTLRALMRQQAPEARETDLTSLVTNVLGCLAFKAKKVEASFQMDLCPARVSVDQMMISQVLVNLISNALDAVINQPLRMIRVQSVEESESVLVSVTDSGPGVPQERQEALFQPFMTTKAGGMGLGLVICGQIVAAHGSKMGYEDAPGGGATFSFALPKC